GIAHPAHSAAGRTSSTVNLVPRSRRSRRASLEMVVTVTATPLRRRLLRREQHRLHAVGFGRVARRFLPKRKAQDDRRAHPLEPRVFEQPEHLSLRESAADSAGPELGVIDDGLRELLRAHDVGDGEPAPSPDPTPSRRAGAGCAGAGFPRRRTTPPRPAARGRATRDRSRTLRLPDARGRSGTHPRGAPPLPDTSAGPRP